MKIRRIRQAVKGPSDIIDKVSAALRAQFKKEGTDDPLYWYPKEVMDDAVIVCSDDSKMYRIPYSIGENDEVTFGEPVEVEEEYVDVKADPAEVTMQSGFTIRQSLDPEGWKWRFQVVAWGISKTRHIWRGPVFQQSLREFEWENLPAYSDHPTDTELRELPERSIKNKVGWWSNFEITGEGMDATLTIKPSADWVRQDIKAAYEAGNLDFYGASILVAIQAKQVNWSDGHQATDVTRVRPISIDLVTDAAAGGKVKYALASSRARNNDEGDKPIMNKTMLALLFKASKDRFQLVRQSLVTAGANGVTAETNEDQLAEVICKDEKLVEQAIAALQAAPTPGDGPSPRAGDPPGDLLPGVTFLQLPPELRESMIAQSIKDSGLPEAVQQKIKGRLTSSATLQDVNAQIEGAREVLAVTAQSGQVFNPRAEVGAEYRDRLAIGLAKAWDLTRDQYLAAESYIESEVRQSGGRIFEPEQSVWNTIPPLRSLKKLYIEMTGDEELKGRAQRPTRLTRQAQTPYLSTDFTDLLSNLMHKRLIMSYREVDYGWRRVVTIKSVQDFKAQQAILLGYFGDLPTVNQNGEYSTVAALTDDKESYSVTKRGFTFELTLEVIANDDLRGFGLAVGRAGRAAHRTLAKFVWNTCLFANPTLNQDGVALFHATHNNLITDALSTTGLKNGITKLLSQTEPGSNEKIQVSTMDLTLAVPPGSYLDSISLTDFNQEPEGNTDPLAREIRRMGIMPVNLPILTDANDWGLFASPRDIDIVEIGFFNGNEEPEFFDLMGETHEKAFNNDVISRHKIRHIYGGVPVDFRGAVKSVVV